jgi:hypothetical protein
LHDVTSVLYRVDICSWVSSYSYPYIQTIVWWPQGPVAWNSPPFFTVGLHIYFQCKFFIISSLFFLYFEGTGARGKESPLISISVYIFSYKISLLFHIHTIKW